jgi:hypothetical protein
MNETSDFKRSDPLMSARQVVERWPDAGITRQQLWRWGREGLIDMVRLPSGRVKFRQSTIEALLSPSTPSVSSVSSVPGVEGVELPGQGALL